LPSRNKVIFAVDEKTSTLKLAMTLVMAYFMDGHWALEEVLLAFDKVDSLSYSYCETNII
jgi:hypothetical protein